MPRETQFVRRQVIRQEAASIQSASKEQGSRLLVFRSWLTSRIKSLFKTKKRVAASGLAAVVIASLIFSALPFGNNKAVALSQGPNSAAATGDCVKGTGVGTVDWTSPGNAFSSNNTNATVSVDGTTSTYIKCTNFGFSIPSGATIVGIVVGIERSASNNNNGGVTDAAMRIVKGGTIGSTDKSTASVWPLTDAYEDHGGTSDLWGDSWSTSDINGSTFGAAIAATKASGGGAAITANVDHMRITVYYTGNSQIDQNGYIWENDDSANSGSAQAAGNTAITSVRKGERLALRMQVKNTGTTTLSTNLGLFYDQNDNNFVQVTSPTAKQTAGSGCTSSAWTCTAVDTTNNVGSYNSIAISPNGTPYVSYQDSGPGDLRVAQYVGSGGTGCASSAWTCTAVDTTNLVGYYTSIAFSPSGAPYVSYKDGSNSDLRVAQYVGSGGSGCASSAWTCTAVDTTGSMGDYTSIAFNSSGAPYVSYQEGTNGDLRVAQYVGSGGSGCASSAWTCTAVDTTNTVGNFTSIAFSPDDTPYVSYYDATNGHLRVAQYVGSGGSGCASSAWTCTAVETTNSAGFYTSIAFSPGGKPYVSYQTNTNGDLRVAQYVGSGGSGCASSAWTCTAVDTTNTVGYYTSLAFSPSGVPYVGYQDATNGGIRVAQYVGSGGSGCASSAWTCTAVHTVGGVIGEFTSIAFSPTGIPYISYQDGSSGDLLVAQLARAGAITFAPSTNSGSITSSHADMTTVSDSGNKSDADCIGGGTWQNGVIATSPEVKISLPAGNCTEVTFIIDTSQATFGTTYRFVIAGADAIRSDKGRWRGPATVASSAYATLTLSQDIDAVTFSASKDVEPQGSVCSWTCTDVDTTNSVGSYTSIAFSPSGAAYIAYEDTTNSDLRVAQYVGTGGSGCASSAWTCTAIETANVVGDHTSIAFNPSGVPYISYYDLSSSGLRVAQYVGTGGSGCASSAWTCTAVDTTNLVGDYSSLAFSPGGIPYVSYSDTTNNDLRVAQYVGSGGTGCDSSAWTCTAVDTSNTVGTYTSIAFNPSGAPYISYYDLTNSGLRVAQYVGSGGSGCASSAWTCSAVDSTNSVGQYTSIAFSPSGAPYISYYDTTNSDLRVAQYVGSGGSGCDSGAWTCTAIETTDAAGQYNSIAFSPDGTPYISYNNASDSGLSIAKYVGSGGFGCDSSAWTCTSIDSTNAVGTYTSIAFSPSGTAYISYYYGTGSDLRVAKLSLSDQKPISSSLFGGMLGRNGAWSDGRWHLADGRSPRSSNLGSCSGAVATFMGYCGLFNDDGNTDSIVAQINEIPVYNFSFKVKSNSELPTISWVGRSSLAPNTGGGPGNLNLQVYRFGTTNGWVTVASDSSSSNCNTENCKLMGIPGGTISEYFEADGSDYRIHVRVWQQQSSSTSITFSTDSIQLQYLSGQMRHGLRFENGIRRPFSF